MKVGLWETRYRLVYDNLTEKEMDFIQKNFEESGDGTYFIDLESLSKIIDSARINGSKTPKGLVKALKKRLADGSAREFCFRIF